MFEKIASIIKPRFFIIVITCALIGTISLYFYAMSIEPEELSIGDIDMDDVGLTVSTRGVVKEARLGEALYITLIDLELPDSILVYVPLNVYQDLDSGSLIIPGTELGVKGEVKEYNGRLEIYVRAHTSLTILSESKDIIIRMEDLAESPELFEGLNLSVEGVVTDIETFLDSDGVAVTRLRLTSGDYSLDCVLYGKDSIDDMKIGASMIFKGSFEYNEDEFGWCLVDVE